MSALFAKRWIVIALVGLAFLASWLPYLSQPSSKAFDEDGSPHSRLVELMVMPNLAQQFYALQVNGAPEAIIDKIPLFAAAAAWLCLAFVVGRPLVAASRLPFSSAEFRGLSVLFGLTIFSTLTLLVGLAGLLGSRWPLTLCVAGLTAVAYFSWLKIRAASDGSTCKVDADKGTTPTKGRKGAAANRVSVQEQIVPQEAMTVWATRLTQLLIVVLAFSYLQFGAIAPSEFDVLEYHLGAPKEFHRAGQVFFTPNSVYANMPLGIEMHSLAAMTLVSGSSGWWWGAMIGKVVVATFSLLGAYIIYGYVGRKYGTPTNWFAAGLYLAIGGNIYSSTTGLVDYALGVYVLAAVVVLEKLTTLETDDRESAPGRVWFARVFLLGCFSFGAMACKYTGLVFCAVPVGCCVAYFLVRKRLPCPIPTLVAASMVAALVTAVPWLAKNFIASGNPVFPLASGLFGGLDAGVAERWAGAHTPGGGEGFGLLQLVASCKRFLFGAQYQLPSIVFCVLGAVVISCWPKSAAASVQSATPENRRPEDSSSNLPLFFTVAGAILAVWWIATHRLDRFWFPAMPLLAIVAARFLHWVRMQVAAGLAVAIVLPSVLFGLMLIFSGSAPNDARWLVPQREFYQSLTEPTERSSFGDTVAWCNSQFGDGDGKVALVGQAAIFPFTISYSYATCFNEPPVKRLVQEQGPQQQLAALKAEGISHIVIDWAEIARYRSPGNYGFDSWPQRSDIDKLIQSGVAKEMETPFATKSFQVLEVAESSSE